MLTNLMNYIIVCVITAVTGCAIPSGYPTVVHLEPQPVTGPTLTDRVKALEERMQVLEDRIEFQNRIVLQLIGEQQDPQQCINLIQYTANIELLTAQLKAIDGRLADAISALDDLHKQRKELLYERD